MEVIDLEIQRVEKQIEALEAAYEDAQSGTDMEQVNSARIEINRIANQIDTATTTKNRTEELYNEGMATLVELEQSLAYINQLQSSLGIAQSTYNQLVKEISENVRKKYEAEIDALLISIEILEKSREDSSIYADIDGIVTELNTFEGDKPSVGLMIMEIQDTTDKVVLVDFMVEDAIRIKTDSEAEIEDLDLDITIDNLKVDKVYPKAFLTLSELGVEENRQTIEIGLPSSDTILPFGLEVQTKVLLDTPRQLLLVPVGAVVEEDSMQYVEVLEDGKVVEREITTGVRIDGNIEVVTGLVEGEEVVLNYQEEEKE